MSTQQLRVLLTNNTLDTRAGTELYVLEVATELLRRGHHPICFSKVLGDVADELRKRTIAVTDELDMIAVPPDVIHGHHHLETMTALLQFPDAAVISYTHGWSPWEERPPVHPRIRHYVTVDDLCYERLVYEHGIPPEKITLIRNFFDPGRLVPRTGLPAVPRRALAFGNTFAAGPALATLRAACSKSGLKLDVVGIGAGNVSTDPYRLLPDYDIVFAKGRAAIEAIAVGCAVIMCDGANAGPIVTSENVEWARRYNFGLRTRLDRLTVSHMVEQISRYDAPDAMRVSAVVREKATLPAAVDQIVELYREALAARRPVPVEEDRRAIAAYLSAWNVENRRRTKDYLELRARSSDFSSKLNDAASSLGRWALRLFLYVVTGKWLGALAGKTGLKRQ